MLQWETGTFSLLFCHDRITWFKSLFYIGWITCHLGKENQKYCAFLRPKCKKQGMERPHQPLQPLFCVVFTLFRAIFPHKRRKSLFSLGRQKRFFRGRGRRARSCVATPLAVPEIGGRAGRCCRFRPLRQPLLPLSVTGGGRKRCPARCFFARWYCFFRK